MKKVQQLILTFLLIMSFCSSNLCLSVARMSKESFIIRDNGSNLADLPDPTVKITRQLKQALVQHLWNKQASLQLVHNQNQNQEGINIIGDESLKNYSKIFSWRGDGSPADPILIENLGLLSYFEISDVSLHFIIQNNEFSFPNPSWGGLAIRSCQNVSIINNIIKDCRKAIWIYLSDHTVIKQNILENNGWGIHGEILNNIIIQNNVIRNSNYSGIEIKSTPNAKILNNTIQDNILSGISLRSSSNALISGNNLVRNGIDISGSDLDEFNHTILENSFTEFAFLYVKNEDQPLIPPNSFSQLIMVNCTNFQISKEVLQSYNTPITIAYSKNISLQNNTFITTGDPTRIDIHPSNGIDIVGSESIELINNSFERKCNGLYFMKNSNFTVENNLFCNNTNSISVKQSERGEFSHNMFTSSIRGLIFDSNCKLISIQTNQIIMNEGNGLELNYASDFDIIGNNISQNHFWGIKVSHSNSILISNNRIIDNSIGIVVGDKSHGVVIEYNYIANNNIGINYATDGSITLKDNTLINNDVSIVSKSQESTQERGARGDGTSFLMALAVLLVLIVKRKRTTLEKE